MIARQIENGEVGKTPARQKNDHERKTAFKQPCGHAAPVDSRAPHPARLPTSAWISSRRFAGEEIHMPTGPATTFASLKNRETTTRNLNGKKDLQ
jgi:hypothetical protein